jgi:hypothetical protein
MLVPGQYTRGLRGPALGPLKGWAYSVPGLRSLSSSSATQG